MSSSGYLNERTITATLLSLWRRPETTIQGLLRDTLAPLTDVQESLKGLRQRRCIIEETPAGVRLVSTGLPCWRDILEDSAKRLRLRCGRRVMVYLKTASTNDIAWQCAVGSPEETDGLLIVADEQTAGRGRLGHTWMAKPEQSILCSLLLRDVPRESVDRLTLLAGLAAAHAIETVVPSARVTIKWPNDLLVGGRKVAGILVERRDEQVVIGVGINVAQGAGDFPPELAGRATSLYAATGMLTDRLRIMTALLEQVDHHLQLPHAEEAWLGEWKSRCEMLNTRITARTGDQTLVGDIVDIDPLRGLLVRDVTGSTHFLSAQTTTLAAS